MRRLCGLCFAGLLLAAPASAAPRELVLEYEAYFGGLHLVSARTVILRNQDAYEVSAQARARGLLDWYSQWRGKALSQGVIGEELAIMPSLHENQGSWQDKERNRSLTYKPDGEISVEGVDPPNLDKVTAIPEGSTAGTVDPISAIMALAHRMEEVESCTGTIPVYDGRRRYNIVVEQGENQAFSPNDYTIFDGEARACNFRIERIGGFRIEQSKYQETARDRRVWVASPLDGAPPIPVRVDVQTDYGNLVIHLTAARFGGQEIALNPGEDNLSD